MTDRVRVVVKCPDCVETRIDSDDVTLRHCVDDESWSYRFVCPLCRRPAVSPTGRLAALDAMLVGCPLESWRLPAELLEHRGGPPLTLDRSGRAPRAAAGARLVRRARARRPRGSAALTAAPQLPKSCAHQYAPVELLTMQPIPMLW